MLGHTSAKVTLDTYADLFDDDLDAVADTLHASYSVRSAGKGWAGLRTANIKIASHLGEQARGYGGGGGI
jgi:hypothetical protein